MTYRIEIMTELYHLTRGDIKEWRPYKSNTGHVYVWGTKIEAEIMAELRFANLDPLRLRVVENS